MRSSRSFSAAVIICFLGILYRGGAERKIWQYPVGISDVDCIIRLSGNLFFGTNITTCIMVLQKNRIDHKILFIDDSGACIKATNNNNLAPDNIDSIVDTFANCNEETRVSCLASHEKIAAKKYNLSVSTSVKTEGTQEEIDIAELNTQIVQIVDREQILRDKMKGKVENVSEKALIL